MSKADIERFIADLKGDTSLLDQVKDGSTGLASVVKMANERGYKITVDEAKAYIDEQAKAELTDEQLDAVAGGKGGGGGGGGGGSYTSTATAVSTVEAAVTVTSGVEVAEAATTVVVVSEGAVVLT